MSRLGTRSEYTREATYISFLRDAKGLTDEDVTSEVSEAYNRLTNSDKLERLVCSVWDCNTETNPNICSKMKFRLHGIDLEPPPKPPPPPLEEGEEPPPEEEGEPEIFKIHFKLGITNCRDFMGTNLLPYQHDVQQLQVMGQRNYCNRGAYLANPLGTGAMILTEDKNYVFLRRISDCCESRRLVDRAVGLPDPLRVPLPERVSDLAKAASEDLIKELWSSMVRGVEDEIGLPGSSLTDIELMGVSNNCTKGERPCLEFHMNCTLSMERVIAIYAKCRHSGWYRSAAVLFTTEREVKEVPLHKSMFFKGLAPSAKGAVLLVREMVSQQRVLDRENRMKKPE